MCIFIHAIFTQTEGEAAIKQLRAAQEAGIARVGIFELRHGQMNSQSQPIENAVRIINSHIATL